VTARRARSGTPTHLPLGPEADARIAVGRADTELPSDYVATLGEIKQRLRESRTKALMGANAALVLAYWEVGRVILVRQQRAGWGAGVIGRLSCDLRRTLPGMHGLSARNLFYMRAFAAAWPKKPIVQQLAAQMPWSHHCLLLARLSDHADREWYARQIVEKGWSRNVLAAQITARVHLRQGRAQTNFESTLHQPDADLAAQAFKDPYLFDFLGMANPRREHELEQGLVDHIQHFLLELGAGFAFVGRQVPLEVGDQDFQLDLLFYHLTLRRFVVIELKAGPFEPAFAGQMNLYLSAVDDLLRHAEDRPTIGLLLCRERNRLVVEYALRDVKKPIGVAQWETRLVDSLPADLRSTLPTVEEIERELGPPDPGGGRPNSAPSKPRPRGQRSRTKVPKPGRPPGS
jgi:predicted nuclease of restriction endonuclease-like (RecB) superfamily